MTLTFVARGLLAAGLGLAIAGTAIAQSTEPFEPYHGQPGRDVVWVPTPPVLVETMLDMAQLTPQDFVMDLGSGDGRNIIAAAKRGARATGVEFNPDMVALSRRLAAEAGVADRATFIEGDMYAADISQASVMALFLLTENLNVLVPKFLALKPGSRIVVNGFRIDNWREDETRVSTGDCNQWCTAYLYIVPAKVEGTWRLQGGDLSLRQEIQQLTGSRGTQSIADGRVTGEQISFRLGQDRYEGRVQGDTMTGIINGDLARIWTASRS